MSSKQSEMQVLDRNEALLAVLAVVVAGLYQALWYLAEGFMRAPVWEGGAVPWSMLLGLVALFAPLGFATLMVRKDHDGAPPRER